jgi:hypothetical protein
MTRLFDDNLTKDETLTPWERWVKRHPQLHRERNRKDYLKRFYDMTPEDYDKIFFEQKGRCGICNKHQTELSQSLGVDHSHITGKIRGLLCKPCNSILGYSRDDQSILQQMIVYLRKHSGD